MSAAAFPLIFLSDQLTLDEFFRFTDRMKQAFADEPPAPKPPEFYAFSVESQAQWLALGPPAAPEAIDRTAPERLLLIAFSPRMRERLWHTGMTCGQSKRAGQFSPSIDKAPALFARLFAAMEAQDFSILNLAEANAETPGATLILTRTAPTIAKVMQALRISGWRELAIAGYWISNLGRPLPVAFLPEDASLHQFAAEADNFRNTLGRDGLRTALGVEAFIPRMLVTPPIEDRLPKRLILASGIAGVTAALQEAARTASASGPLNHAGRFQLTKDHSAPGAFAEIFREMEALNQPVVILTPTPNAVTMITPRRAVVRPKAGEILRQASNGWVWPN